MNACLGKKRTNIPQTYCAHKLVFASKEEEEEEEEEEEIHKSDKCVKVWVLE